MHEFKLVKREVERIKDKTNGKNVSKIVFALGRLAHGTPGSIREAFKVATLNTSLFNAVVEVIMIDSKVKCSSCDNIFSAEGEFNFSCPKCSSSSNELISGNECYIDRIEILN